jgi:hypothetical protein
LRPSRLVNEGTVRTKLRGTREETTMERNFEDVGHRVESESGMIFDMRKAACAVGSELQDRREQVLDYARREPETALTAAATLGLLVGLALALGSRSGSASGSAWLPQLGSRRGLFGKRTGSSWRERLGLE